MNKLVSYTQSMHVGYIIYLYSTLLLWYLNNASLSSSSGIEGSFFHHVCYHCSTMYI